MINTKQVWIMPPDPAAGVTAAQVRITNPFARQMKWRVLSALGFINNPGIAAATLFFSFNSPVGPIPGPITLFCYPQEVLAGGNITSSGAIGYGNDLVNPVITNQKTFALPDVWWTEEMFIGFNFGGGLATTQLTSLQYRIEYMDWTPPTRSRKSDTA